MIPKYLTSWKALFSKPRKGTRKELVKENLRLFDEQNQMLIEAVGSLFKQPNTGAPMPQVKKYGNRTPYPYQLESQPIFDKFKGRVLLADAMGLGKSFQAMIWSLNNPKKRPIIIICPAHLKYNWYNECAMVGIKAEVLEHRTPRRFNHHAEAYIINYDILGDPLETHTWTNKLMELEAKIIIADEVHRLSNPSTQWTINVTRLAQGVPHFFALTGTPITNNPADLFPVLHILRPEVFDSLFGFANTYAQPKMLFGKWTFKGAKRLRLLNHRLNRWVMVRRRKEDVLKDLPEKQMIVVPLTLDEAGMKEYHHTLYNFRDWLKQNKPEKVSKTGDSAFARLEYLKQVVYKHKQPAVVNWINDYLSETDDKLMIFGIHRDNVVQLHEKFKKCSTMVHGSITGRERETRFMTFNNDSLCRLLIGNLMACGEGWSSRWPTNVHIEFDWKPRSHTQASERGHGVNRGQKGTNCTSYYLVAKGTIEENICKLLQTKQEISDKAVDGMMTGESFNIYSELISELQKELIK